MHQSPTAVMLSAPTCSYNSPLTTLLENIIEEPYCEIQILICQIYCVKNMNTYLVIGCRDLPPGTGRGHMELYATGPHTWKISQPKWCVSHSCWEQIGNPYYCQDSDAAPCGWVVEYNYSNAFAIITLFGFGSPLAWICASNVVLCFMFTRKSAR